MRFSAIVLGGCAALGGCHQASAPDRSAERQSPAAMPSSDGKPAPLPARPAAPAAPSRLPGSPKPASAAPVAAESAEAAAEVVRSYFALVEAGRRAEARQLWEEAGKASEFGADLRRYRFYRAEVGAPGQVEGAAGSSYVVVPIRLDGRLKDGTPFRRRAQATLRRVNDVPGSTADQRRWHIRDIAPAEASE
jgi:hypothetical protein